MEAVIRRSQEETKAAINFIRAELEETIKNRTKNVLASVAQQTQGLREEINETQEEGWTTVWKRPGAEGKGGTPAYTLRPHHQDLTVITERTEPSLVTQVWVGETPCPVTIDTVRECRRARHGRRTSRKATRPQTVSAEALPILQNVAG
jgi:hypothetical protein